MPRLPRRPQSDVPRTFTCWNRNLTVAPDPVKVELIYNDPAFFERITRNARRGRHTRDDTTNMNQVCDERTYES